MPAKEEYEALSATPIDRFKELIDTIGDKIEDVKSRIIPIQKSIDYDEIFTSGGVSLLEVKYHTLISYITNYSFYLLLKLHGQRIENHHVIEKLIEARVYLEKIKPLESKLKYQIEKVIKAAAMTDDVTLPSSNVSLNEDLNPLAFKPNPMGLSLQNENKKEVVSFDANVQLCSEPFETEVYRPPKIAPAYFDESNSSARTKMSAQMKDRASKSRLLNELRAQYDERPEEMTAHGTGYATREVGNELDEKWAERERFEEENFVRLNLTREDKKLRKLIEKKGSVMRFQDEFDNIDTDFRDLAGLSRAIEAEDVSTGARVLQKTRLSSAINKSNGKRKFHNVNHLISSNAQEKKGNDIFGSQVKRSRTKSNKKKI